ncbi:MAG: type IV pilus modification PilV family protein [Desulfomonilia bacterium]
MTSVSKMRKLLGSRLGFTLIELVVAIFIFALGIMGIVKMQSQAIQANSYSMQLTDAVNIAQDHLERLRGLTFAHDSMSTALHTTSTNLHRGIPFNLSWRVSDPGTFRPSREVLVSVRWQEKAINHQITMEVLWDELN